MQENQEIIISARLRFAKPIDETVLQAVAALVAATRAEAGCLEYQPHLSPQDAHGLLFHERWKDQAAVDAHFASAHLKAFGAQMSPLLSGERDLTFWKRLD